MYCMICCIHCRMHVRHCTAGSSEDHCNQVVRCTRTVSHVFIWKIPLQSLDATLGDLSALYAATCMSSLRRVCADAATAKGIVIQPAIDADIVPERYVSVVGQQRDHGQPQGPPQGKSGSFRLFLERNADQMSLVAHYIHLCFQARMSDESHLAPHPGL
ncbi:TPA: hypothetical protein ACH3X2_002563 [Trebouxia sp. C0005]